MNKFYRIILIAVFVFTFFTRSIFASTLNLDTRSSVVKTGDSFVLKINLDTENKSVNTLEGDLIYDASVIVPQKVLVNESFVSFWIEEPNLDTKNKIHFSGIVPGGIISNKSNVFSVVFDTIKQEKTSISLSDTNLYLNDGEASKDTVKNKNLNIEISDNAQSFVYEKETGDKTKPEVFQVQHTSNEYVFDGKKYVVFSTQDKGSGIAYYEVCEFGFKKCTKAKSPYLLTNQTIFYSIKVLAYDNSGNIQKSQIVSTAFMILISFLLFLFLVAIAYLCYRIYKKNKL